MNLLTTIVPLALLLPAIYVSLFFLERWANAVFVRAQLASMLMGVLGAAIFIAALCVAPSLSALVSRLGPTRSRADVAPPSGPRPTRIFAAGVAAAAMVFTADLVGWLTCNNFQARALAGGFASGLAISLTIGFIAAAPAILILALSRPRSSVDSFTVGPIRRASRSLVALIAGGVATGIVLAIAVPVRAPLMATPWSAALFDLSVLIVALFAFSLVSTISRKLLPRERKSWRPVGVALMAAGVIVCVATVIWRPFLDSSGLLDLLFIGTAFIFSMGVVLLLPPALRPRTRRTLVLLPILGVLALAGAHFFEALRPDLMMDLRPARWLTTDLASRWDMDGDGYSPFFGVDCDDFDPFRNPSAAEIPGNGIDDNCRYGDRFAPLPWKPLPTYAQLPAGFEKPRRVLLLAVDALRNDRLSCNGYGKPTTPNIDKLAARSVHFHNAYSASPTTRYAFPVLFTGRAASEILWDNESSPIGVLDENTTIAELMREQGFRTAAFLTYYGLKNSVGMMQGFQYVNNRLARPRSRFWRDITSEKVVDRVIKWMKSHREDSWFAFIHFMDPHSSYMPHKGIPDFGEGHNGLYDGEVFFTDRAIGRLLDKMKDLGIYDDTAIVLLADHGEMLGDHGQMTHGKGVWQEALKIPLMISVPGVEPREVSAPVSLTDVAPTIANLVGVDAGTQGMTGPTLVPTLFGASAPEREVISEIGTLRALVGPRYKLVYKTNTQATQLYDIADDPKETSDLARAKPKITRKMKDRLLAWEEHCAGNQVANVLPRVTVNRIPSSVKFIDASFPNGLEVLALDAGNRSVTTDHPLRMALYLRLTRRLKERCKVRVLAHNEEEKKAKLLGTGPHDPAKGRLPIAYFPMNKIVEDVFHLSWRGESGTMKITMALRCEGDHMGAVEGPGVLEDGWIDLGDIEVSKRRRKKPKKPEKPSTNH